MDDSEIIRLIAARRESALQALREKYEPLCMTVAYNMLGSREDAEECFSDALLKVWKSLADTVPQSLGAYLLTAVRNAARDRLSYQNAARRGGKELALAIDELSDSIESPAHPDRIADSLALKDAFRRFLNMLRPKERVIFLDRYWLCLSAKEIAAETGFPAAYVNVSLMRTRKKLRTFLEKEELL